MTTSNPVFVFVPGAWHSPNCFQSTIQLLSERGYSSQGINLASVGSQTPLENFDADVEIIRKTISNLVSTGADVVIVMYSYGSSPASEALKYFLDDNDCKDGKGRIVRMDLPWFRVQDREVTADSPKIVFYNDLSDADGEKWANTLKPHSYRTFYSEVSVEPWMTIPSAYLLCEKDNAIPLQAQEGMVAMAKGKNSKAFDLVEKCGAGHSPFLSMPDTVATFLVKSSKVG